MRLIDADALPKFPTILRKMWSGGEVKQWIQENIVNAPTVEQATIVTQIDAVKFQEALDAMCADKDKQIAELQQVIANQSMQLAHDAVTLESYENKFNQMQAQINELREALEAECGGRCNAEYNPCHARQALAKTTPQCLQEHDNEVIERCAKVCDELVIEVSGRSDLTVDQCAKTIRALKGKQNE